MLTKQWVFLLLLVRQLLSCMFLNGLSFSLLLSLTCYPPLLCAPWPGAPSSEHLLWCSLGCTFGAPDCGLLNGSEAALASPGVDNAARKDGILSLPRRQKCWAVFSAGLKCDPPKPRNSKQSLSLWSGFASPAGRTLRLNWPATLTPWLDGPPSL